MFLNFLSFFSKDMQRHRESFVSKAKSSWCVCVCVFHLRAVMCFKRESEIFITKDAISAHRFNKKKARAWWFTPSKRERARARARKRRIPSLIRNFDYDMKKISINIPIYERESIGSAPFLFVLFCSLSLLVLLSIKHNHSLLMFFLKIHHHHHTEQRELSK